MISPVPLMQSSITYCYPQHPAASRNFLLMSPHHILLSADAAVICDITLKTVLPSVIPYMHRRINMNSLDKRLCYHFLHVSMFVFLFTFLSLTTIIWLLHSFRGYTQFFSFTSCHHDVCPPSHVHFLYHEYSIIAYPFIDCYLRHPPHHSLLIHYHYPLPLPHPQRPAAHHSNHLPERFHLPPLNH